MGALSVLGKKNGIVFDKKTTEYIAWSSVNVGTMQPGIRECANFTLPTTALTETKTTEGWSIEYFGTVRGGNGTTILSCLQPSVLGKKIE